MLEQCGQVGVVDSGEDDEPGIDGDEPMIGFDLHRVAVTAKPGRLLIDRDIMAVRQQPCRGKAGDACTNDGDA